MSTKNTQVSKPKKKEKDTKNKWFKNINSNNNNRGY